MRSVVLRQETCRQEREGKVSSGEGRKRVIRREKERCRQEREENVSSVERRKGVVRRGKETCHQEREGKVSSEEGRKHIIRRWKERCRQEREENVSSVERRKGVVRRGTSEYFTTTRYGNAGKFESSIYAMISRILICRMNNTSVGQRADLFCT